VCEPRAHPLVLCTRVETRLRYIREHIEAPTDRDAHTRPPHPQAYVALKQTQPGPHGHLSAPKPPGRCTHGTVHAVCLEAPPSVLARVHLHAGMSTRARACTHILYTFVVVVTPFESKLGHNDSSLLNIRLISPKSRDAVLYNYKYNNHTSHIFSLNDQITSFIVFLKRMKHYI